MLCLHYPAAALLMFGWATHGFEEPTDLDRLQGNWQVVKIEDGSDASPPAEVVKEMWFAIKGKNITPRRGLFLTQHTATFKLDASKKPRTIDLLGFGQKQVTAPNGGETKVVPNPDPVLGIYELAGDELRLCLAGSGAPKDRPKEFKALDKQRQALLVLRRKKD